MKLIARTLFRLVAGIVTISSASLLHAADPFAEGVRPTPPKTAEEQAKTFQLPPGFEMQLVAQEPDINKPFNLAFDIKGRLWVTTSIEYPFAAPLDRPGRDRLMIFEDFAADGRARKVTEFAGGLNVPIGIYPLVGNAKFKHDAAIVWSIPNIWLMEDTDGDGKADKRTVLYGPFDHTRDTHGNQASFRRGFDGWLYATHGFNNDSHVKGRDGHEVHMNSGNTYRMRLDGSRIEHHTWGQVNPYGLAWDPQGNLYSSDCHTAPAYQLLAGGYYPSFGKPHDGLGFAPFLMEHLHGSTAIDGMLYYADDLWPEEFHGNIFVGNVMTSRVNRDRLAFNGSSPKAIEMPDLLRAEDPWFRPVDNRLGPDGALYIADFYNRIIGHYEVPLRHPGRDRERGRIWRLVYKGPDGKAKLRPVALPTEVDGLVEALGSPNLTRRIMAMNAIADQFGDSAAPKVRRALEEARNAFQRVHALWLLERFNHLDDPTLVRIGSHSDPLARTHALRLITERGHARSIRPTREGDVLLPASLTNFVRQTFLQDSDPLVRRCAAEALGVWIGHADFEHVPLLLQGLAAADREDTHLVYVVRKAIRDQLNNEAVFARVLNSKWSAAEGRALADIALAVKSPMAGSFLLQQFLSNPLHRSAADQWLRHAARYAPASEMDKLASVARGRLTQVAGVHEEMDLQFALFKSVDEGLRQRGTPMPTPVQDWGMDLTRRFFGALTPIHSWKSAAYEPNPTANPWGFQTRACADGQQRDLTSSLAFGEPLTGLLRSLDFECPERLSFWLCGHDGQPNTPAQNKNRIRLRNAKTGEVLAEHFAPRTDTAQRITWELAAHRGKPVAIEAQDGNTGNAYAWIAFGGFEPGLPQLRPPEFAPRKIADWMVGAADVAVRAKLNEFAPLFARLTVPKSGADLEYIDPDVSTAFARAWVALAPGESTRELSATLGNASCPPAYRERLGLILSETSSSSAHEAVIAAMKWVPARIQRRWAEALAGSPSGAEVLLGAAEGGTVSLRLLQAAAIRNRIQAAKPANWETRLNKLNQSFPPANETVDRLIADRRNSYLASTPKAAEGSRVFEKNCAVCHQIAGRGGVIAPQLDGLGNRGLERVLEDVFDPNRNVDRAFRTQIIKLKDGEVVSGLFRREEGELVILADAMGKEISVPKKEIESRRESESSLMPENFGEVLTPEEGHDLIAFLLEPKK
jgi:putative heme-binding domain-containing protein